MSSQQLDIPQSRCADPGPLKVEFPKSWGHNRNKRILLIRSLSIETHGDLGIPHDLRNTTKRFDTSSEMVVDSLQAMTHVTHVIEVMLASCHVAN